MQKLGVGIIGCGNISTAYLSLAPLFRAIEVRAVSDLNMVSAQARADEFNVRAETVEDLLLADDIDIIVNLTIPAAHFDVSRRALQAGKHVYSEKPLVLTMAQGEMLRDLASQMGLSVGSAPDTWLGGAHQDARAFLDRGDIGAVTSGSAHVMSHGPEAWHPNPDFFYEPGGGPLFDLGPYYLTNLIQLLGPVARVGALTSAPLKSRPIGSGARKGGSVPVLTPTTIQALLEFHSGARITLTTSWDVWAHDHSHIELYATDGTLFLPDPNNFGGDVKHGDTHGAIHGLERSDHPFGVDNQTIPGGTLMRANYRTAGLADMAQAILDGRAHRCSLELALHGIDVMISILKSGDTGAFVTLKSTCERPEALGPDAARALLN